MSGTDREFKIGDSVVLNKDEIPAVLHFLHTKVGKITGINADGYMVFYEDIQDYRFIRPIELLPLNSVLWLNQILADLRIAREALEVSEKRLRAVAQAMDMHADDDVDLAEGVTSYIEMYQGEYERAELWRKAALRLREQAMAYRDGTYSLSGVGITSFLTHLIGLANTALADEDAAKKPRPIRKDSESSE